MDMLFSVIDFAWIFAFWFFLVISSIGIFLAPPVGILIGVVVLLFSPYGYEAEEFMPRHEVEFYQNSSSIGAMSCVVEDIDLGIIESIFYGYKGDQKLNFEEKLFSVECGDAFFQSLNVQAPITLSIDGNISKSCVVEEHSFGGGADFMCFYPATTP